MFEGKKSFFLNNNKGKKSVPSFTTDREKKFRMRTLNQQTSIFSFFGLNSIFPFLDTLNSLQHSLTLDLISLLIAAACVGAICAVVPWIVALRTASNLTENFIVTKAADGTKQKQFLQNPATGKPLTKSEIDKISLRNQRRVFLAMLFTLPLSSLISVICCLIFMDWGTLKFCGSVVLVLNGALSSMVATNKKL